MIRFTIKMKSSSEFAIFDKKENTESGLILSRNQAIKLADTLNALERKNA